MQIVPPEELLLQRVGVPWVRADQPVAGVLQAGLDPDADRGKAAKKLARIHAMWQYGIFDLAIVDTERSFAKGYAIRPFAPECTGDRLRVLRSFRPEGPKVVVVSSAARRRLKAGGPLALAPRPAIPGLDLPLWGPGPASPDPAAAHLFARWSARSGLAGSWASRS